MKKEFEWELSLDGETHRACCVCSDTRYVIYLDDDHVTNIYRLSGGAMSRGLEAPVELLGKPCLFTVWDETPDLVVDGIMVARGVSYEEAKAQRKKASTLIYEIMTGVGMALLVVSTLLLCLRGAQWSPLVAASALMTVFGAVSVHKWRKW